MEITTEQDPSENEGTDPEAEKAVEMSDEEFRLVCLNTFRQFQQLLAVFRVDIDKLKERMDLLDARSERNAADVHKLLNSDRASSDRASSDG